ncbi:beta-ketoacyl-[acyl-carrier-protein] synthase family protein [Streptomyces sp. NPDC001928]|uniref:beta-ketoacyl-[acyl-carrier-protein] synthase family protein n=1 Tax=Streptomyces sp. NPDC001928 TaxID=3154404 RepID=UPI00331CC197
MITSTVPEVVITGIGVVSAAGVGAHAAWRTVLAGHGTARRDARSDGLAVDVVCRVPDFDPVARLGGTWARRTDRYSQLAFVAGAEALAMAELDPGQWDGTRVGVVIGTGFGGVSTLHEQVLRLEHGEKVSATTVPLYAPNMLPGQLSLMWGATGPSLTVSTACASGATAIGTASALIRSGVCDIVLAGGSDAPIIPVISAAFARMDALASGSTDPATASRPFDVSRGGFVLGEGAAILVLERAAHAAGRRVPAMARLAGFGASADAHHITDPHPQGRGLQQAITTALAQAGASAGEVDHVNAHATGTPKGDLIEATLLARLVGHASVTATKGALGHTVGAAGAIEAALTVMAIAEQTVPPTANLDRLDPQIDLDVVAGSARTQRIRLALSNSVGFGGQNAVLALAVP